MYHGPNCWYEVLEILQSLFLFYVGSVNGRSATACQHSSNYLQKFWIITVIISKKLILKKSINWVKGFPSLPQRQQRGEMVRADPGITTVELVTCVWSHLETNKQTPANQTQNPKPTNLVRSVPARGGVWFLNWKGPNRILVLKDFEPPSQLST